MSLYEIIDNIEIYRKSNNKRIILPCNKIRFEFITGWLSWFDILTDDDKNENKTKTEEVRRKVYISLLN